MCHARVSQDAGYSCSWWYLVYSPDGADSRKQSLILKQSRNIYIPVGTTALNFASNIYKAVL